MHLDERGESVRIKNTNPDTLIKFINQQSSKERESQTVDWFLLLMSSSYGAFTLYFQWKSCTTGRFSIK